MSPLTSTHDTARHHARENQSSCPSNGSFVSLPITCSEHAGGPRTAMPCEHTRAHDGCVQEFTKLARRSRMIHTAIPHMPTLFTSHATSPTWESCLGTVRGACCWNFRVPTALATPRTMTGCNAIADPRAPSRCGKGGLACDARTCRIMRQTQAHWRILRSPEWRPRCCYHAFKMKHESSLAPVLMQPLVLALHWNVYVLSCECRTNLCLKYFLKIWKC